MAGIYNYEALTLPELQTIDPARTVCLMTVSPLEVHGPHLPLGTDVIIGEKLQREYCKAINKRHPELNVLVLPALYAGSDPLPINGSIAVGARTLEKLLLDYVRGLARQGFRYLIICDNHGGPSHQMAMEISSRRAWRRYKFYLINPFNVIFSDMVKHSPTFLSLVNLKKGECGDDADSHAGTNETSLFLAAGRNPAAGYRLLPPGKVPRASGLAAFLGWIGGILGSVGLTNTKTELIHLKNLLAWVNSREAPSYIGAPGLASAEAGERMLQGHVETAMQLMETALAGQKPCTRPMLWWMRAFRR